MRDADTKILPLKRNHHQKDGFFKLTAKEKNVVLWSILKMTSLARKPIEQIKDSPSIMDSAKVKGHDQLIISQANSIQKI